jgi:uncharacterized membrane protein YuzA (DUF378 family)
MNMTLDKLACALLVIGGLNWGIVGLTGKDLVGGLFGPKAIATRLIFILVGLAAVFYLRKVLSTTEGYTSLFGYPLPHPPPCLKGEVLITDGQWKGWCFYPS